MRQMRIPSKEMVSIRDAGLTLFLWAGGAGGVFGQTVDSFNPVVGTVNALAIQPDGKGLIGDSSALRRVNSTGTVDVAFSPSANGAVNCALIQPDGAIVAGGSFTSMAGRRRSRIARLNADGTLDQAFQSGA